MKTLVGLIILVLIITLEMLFPDIVTFIIIGCIIILALAYLLGALFFDIIENHKEKKRTGR